MTSQKHTYFTTIRESHLDMYGHVNHNAYIPIFEEARWDWITKNGYQPVSLEEAGHGVVILEISLKFRRELLLNQKIRIETVLTAYSKKIVDVHQEIFNEKDELCCTADLKFGLFDIKTRRLLGMTPEWRQALGISEDPT